MRAKIEEGMAQCRAGLTVPAEQAWAELKARRDEQMKVGLVSARYELTPEARADMRDIWNYIAVKNFNPAAADRLWQDIEDACAELAQNPSLGHARRDLTLDRKVLFYRVRDHYLVIYQKDTDPLQIARVLHGARDVKSELQAE